jgi:hypothetical protein
MHRCIKKHLKVAQGDEHRTIKVFLKFKDPPKTLEQVYVGNEH